MCYKQGKLDEAELLFPKIYKSMMSGESLDALAELAGLMAGAGREQDALRLWKRLLSHDQSGDEQRLRRVLANGRTRQVLLALYEEQAAPNPDSATLARTVEFLRREK